MMATQNVVPSAWHKTSPFQDTPFPDHLPHNCYSNARETVGSSPHHEPLERSISDCTESMSTQHRPTAETRSSKTRRSLDRFKTTPVTFEEIREVDEQEEKDDDQLSTCSLPTTSREIQNRTFTTHSKDDLLVLHRKPAVYGSPVHRRNSNPWNFAALPMSPKRHVSQQRRHSSFESLLLQHQLSLPTIPENPTPLNNTNTAQSFDCGDTV